MMVMVMVMVRATATIMVKAKAKARAGARDKALARALARARARAAQVVGVRGLPERRIFSWARLEAARLRIPVSVATRPDPTRPGPTRPGISATRIPPLTMADLVPSDLVGSGWASYKTGYGHEVGLEVSNYDDFGCSPHHFSRGIRFWPSRNRLLSIWDQKKTFF